MDPENEGPNLHQADRLPEAAGHEEWSDFWVTEMRAEQDKETSGDHLAMMTSMSGFKLAVSFLFNSATEAMATATRRAREVTVLSILWTIQPSKLCKPGVVNDEREQEQCPHSSESGNLFPNLSRDD